MSPDTLRRKCVEMLVAADDGHCGSVMSCVEIACAMNDLGIDPIIVSKGHAGMVMYPLLHERGLLSDEDMANFRRRGGRLTMFPNISIPGIPVTTGSLGNGLGMAAGIAQGSGKTVGVILGEGELYEGATWEALLYIAHHQLPVIAVVDYNESIVMGKPKNLLKLSPVQTKTGGFGIPSISCNGHDVDMLKRTMQLIEPPLVVVANTIKGKGVPEWEGKTESHYWIPLKSSAAS